MNLMNIWGNPTKPVISLTHSVILREIVETTVWYRSGVYWYADGAIEAAVTAAEAVRGQGDEAMISAIERELKKREFICNFDDPCDAWAA